LDSFCPAPGQVAVKASVANSEPELTKLFVKRRKVMWHKGLRVREIIRGVWYAFSSVAGAKQLTTGGVALRHHLRLSG
jgi:hypothetical protein